MTKTSARVLVDRDRLNMADKRSVARTCVDIFSAIQSKAREKQLLALACSFILLCEASGIPAQDVFSASKNLMADPMTSTGLQPQFGAMRYHLQTDVLTRA